MNEELNISATTDKPEIQFNRLSGELSIKGRSMPEDAFTFYKPAIEWLTEYSKNPHNETNLIINLEYFNTASAKQIFKIISVVTEIAKNAKVTVKWYYDSGDRDMQASGQRFSKLSNMPFELIENLRS